MANESNMQNYHKKDDSFCRTESKLVDNINLPVIVDDNYLLCNLNLTKGFITRNAKAMGSFCRPRKFFLKNVLLFLDKLALRSINHPNVNEVARAKTKITVNNIFREVVNNNNNRRRNK